MADYYKTRELRGKTTEQLEKILAERRERVRHIRFQVASKTVKNHRQLRFLKREVSRILTVLSEKGQS